MSGWVLDYFNPEGAEPFVFCINIIDFEPHGEAAVTGMLHRARCQSFHASLGKNGDFHTTYFYLGMCLIAFCLAIEYPFIKTC